MTRKNWKPKQYKAKTYIRIPFGEIQYGHVTHRISIWFGGKCFVIWRGNV